MIQDLLNYTTLCPSAMPPSVNCFHIYTERIIRALSALSERRVVGKPQLLSRLRYVEVIRRNDETEREREYRMHYEDIQNWNNEYWSQNNELFNRSKAEYIRRNFGHMNEQEALSHDQLSDFYRDFLEENRDRHVRYNKIWYKNHISLLHSSICAKLSRLKMNLSEPNKG